ncbi:MAG: acyl-homoserine-lactone synthase [Myxococcota bacterium]
MTTSTTSEALSVRYCYAATLHEKPVLQDTMFRDRAAQFQVRRGWDVTVDPHTGWEQDQYDTPEVNPLYVIIQDEQGRHVASCRLLPTDGRTMLEEIFPHLTPNGPFRSPLVWECTRFCLSPSSNKRADAGRLLLRASLELGMMAGATQAVAVFDAPMIRVYRGLGCPPEVLGTQDGISAGVWNANEELRETLAKLGPAPKTAPDN